MVDLFELVTRLSKSNIDFILIGGYASCIHGASTITQDLDICCKFNEDNLINLMGILKEINPVHRMIPNRIPLDISKENLHTFKNLYIDTDLGQLDCLSYVDGIGDYEAVEKYCEIFELDETRLKILSIEGLIKAKSFLGRDKDLLTIKELEQAKKKNNGD